MLLAAVGWLACGTFDAHAQGSQRSEYEVKAAFLPLFAQFVKWPPMSFADTNAPLVIGILGDDPFGEALDRAVKNLNAVDNRKLVIKRSRKVADVKSCHVLFICKSEKDRLDQILADIAGGGGAVLTVGDTDGFAARGGMINFVLRENKVRFEINRDAAAHRNLCISSELLSLANIVAAKNNLEPK
ncbi:MAG: YfiR family protein [Kiritimatiellia bacterium]